MERIIRREGAREYGEERDGDERGGEERGGEEVRNYLKTTGVDCLVAIVS